jgi:hypothetical protein
MQGIDVSFQPADVRCQRTYAVTFGAACLHMIHEQPLSIGALIGGFLQHGNSLATQLACAKLACTVAK